MPDRTPPAPGRAQPYDDPPTMAYTASILRLYGAHAALQAIRVVVTTTLEDPTRRPPADPWNTTADTILIRTVPA